MRYLRIFLLGRFVVVCCSTKVLYLGVVGVGDGNVLN